MYDKILIHVRDQAREAQTAREARKLLSRPGTLVLLGVVNRRPSDKAQSRLVGAAHRKLTELARLLRTRDVTCVVTVRAGEVATEVAAAAEAHDVGLIVAAAPVVPGVRGLLGENPAQSLVAGTTRPVLLARGPTPGGLPDRDDGVARIVLPVDTAPGALDVVRHVVHFARHLRGKVVGLQVTRSGEGGVALEAAGRAIREHGVMFVPVTRRSNDIAGTVLYYCREQSVDLLAIAPGPAEERSWWKGDLATRAIRRAAVPLLIVKQRVVSPRTREVHEPREVPYWEDPMEQFGRQWSYDRWS